MRTCEISDGIRCWVTSVGDLIEGKGAAEGGKNPPLCIPPYQRDYAWEEENVMRLCKDLEAAICDGRAEYHLGTLIFHADTMPSQPGDHDKKDDVWAVVDGQQRLTSIGVILNREFVRREKPLTDKARCMISDVLGRYHDRASEIRQFLLRCSVVCILVDDVAEAFQLFDTQNGRGKELTPVNLLKAYHFHEMNRPSEWGNPPSDKRMRELESRWETSNAMFVKGGEGLLTRVFAEHLFRLRRWSRGDEEDIGFTKKQIGEFKGLTIGRRDDSLPLQNAAILRKLFREHYAAFGFSLDAVGSRLGKDKRDPVGMDPFMSATQAIVNGEDFFDYAETYSIVYRELFPVMDRKEGRVVSVSSADDDLSEFRNFYRQYCLEYSGANRTGDKYARHVYESLCVFCFDRFGVKGMLRFYRQLYRLAYYERVIQKNLYYETAGHRFAIPLVADLLKCETLSELDDEIESRLSELSTACKSHSSPIRLFDDERSNAKSVQEPGWKLVFGAENVKACNLGEQEVVS